MIACRNYREKKKTGAKLKLLVKRREDRRKETKETQNAIEKGHAGGESMKQESQKKKNGRQGTSGTVENIKGNGKGQVKDSTMGRARGTI